MDPFSIIIGTVSLLDVCTRFGAYLRDLHTGAAQIEDEISALLRELDALKSVNETIKASYNDFQRSYSHEAAVPKQAANLWHNINSSLQDCRRLVEDLEQLVKAIIHREKQDSAFRLANKFESFRKQLRKQSRERDFDKLYGRLNTFHNTLQLMLDLVILWVLLAMCPAYNADTFRTDARQSHSVATESLEEFKRITGKSLYEIRDLLSSIKSSVGVQDAKSVSGGWEYHNARVLMLPSSTTLSALQKP